MVTCTDLFQVVPSPTLFQRHSAESPPVNMLVEKLRGAACGAAGPNSPQCLVALCRGDTQDALRVVFYRLDQALAQYFGEAAEIAEQEEVYPAMPVSVRKCPQCNNDMVLKTRKNGGLVIFPLVEHSLR